MEIKAVIIRRAKYFLQLEAFLNFICQSGCDQVWRGGVTNRKNKGLRGDPMLHLLDNSSWILSALAITIPTILLFLGALWLARKWVSIHELKKNHDVAGFTFSIIGVLYSVILGFTVINVQGRYNDLLESIHTEAVHLADLYRDASFFPEKDRELIRASLREYIDFIIEKEWRHSSSRSVHFCTSLLMTKIWNQYHQVELIDEKMSLWYAETISKLNNLMNARLTRQFNSWQHLSGMLWTILVIGGVITICFMFFFGLENIRSQMLMTALLTGYLSLMLYLVYSLDHAFEGPGRLSPDALKQVQALFIEMDREIY